MLGGVYCHYFTSQLGQLVTKDQMWKTTLQQAQVKHPDKAQH